MAAQRARGWSALGGAGRRRRSLPHGVDRSPPSLRDFTWSRGSAASPGEKRRNRNRTATALCGCPLYGAAQEGAGLGEPVGGGTVQASVRAVETPAVSAAGAASVPRIEFSPPPSTDRRRVPQRPIEWIGLVLGIGFVAAVALGHSLTNDEFWSLAAGQWMLAHHAIMGLDPFSYTEAHRRWVTDEWGSEVALAGLYRGFGAQAYSIYAVTLGSLSLLVTMAYARALGARGGRVAAIVLALAVGISAVVAGGPGPPFSLVWLPPPPFGLAEGP